MKWRLTPLNQNFASKNKDTLLIGINSRKVVSQVKEATVYPRRIQLIKYNDSDIKLDSEMKTISL